LAKSCAATAGASARQGTPESFGSLGISVKLGYGRHRTREKGLKTKVFLVFSVFFAFSVSKKVLITEIPKDRILFTYQFFLSEV
jgi:hypothetical protein